jgi:methyl-accepting chemotaxis protein
MDFIRLKVRTRIYLGFTALIVLSLGIAGFGVYQLSGIGGHVRTMDVLAGVTQRVLSVTRNLEAIRSAETNYLSDAPDASMQEARANAQQANAHLAEAVRVAISQERANIYRSVQDALKAHGANLDQLGQLSATWVAERANLFTGGDALTAATDRLVEAARASSDAEARDTADKVERAMLLIRLANLRFITTQDKGATAAVETSIGNAHAALAALRRAAGPEAGALVAPVEAAMAAYQASFTAFSVARLAANDLYRQQMRPQLMAMQEQLDKAAASLEQSFDTSRRTAVDVVASASLLQAILAAVALVIGAALALVIGRGIVGPLNAMTGVMTKLASGDHGIDIPARGQKDEVGDMARAVEVFKQHAIQAERLTAEQAAERAAKERRQVAMERHTQDFGSSISGVMASLATAADEMRRAAAAMSEAAGAVRQEASGTSEGASKASQDLTSMAAAVEELTSSVAEISRQVAAASDVARQAVQRADSSHGTMQGLSEATARIGDVVRLISDIASQTNLLALNATIEAARAGEAGKGFAVVAGEVKTLAAQTAKATAEIGSQIETVRGATTDAVAAMTEIGGIIGRINEVSAAIAAAVEQQSATTHEIAASVQAVSGATAGTAEAMAHVVMVADNAGNASREVLAGASGIGKEAETLRIPVDQFLAAVRDDSAAERRRYERTSTKGIMVGVQASGRPVARMELCDVSRGGASMNSDWVLPAGTALEVELPDAGGAVRARVVRCGDGLLGVVFTSEPSTLARIDRALGVLMQTDRAA